MFPPKEVKEHKKDTRPVLYLQEEEVIRVTRSCRTIREFKLVKTLTPQHINGTVKKYRGHPFYPERIELIVPGRKHTQVPSETRECAKENNVKIRRFWGFK